MSDELKSIRLQMVITPTQVTGIDRWRREQEDLPSRSEAIRRLVALGIAGEPILREILQMMEHLPQSEEMDAHIASIREMLGAG